MRNFIVTLSEWAFVAFCSVMMILISLADRFGKKKDGSRSALTEASPQEAERPALPPGAIPMVALQDRLRREAVRRLREPRL